MLKPGKKIDTKTEEKLENLQNYMFRSLFAVPKSTPKPMLRFELGQLSMRDKIHVKKLNFIYHLKNLNSENLGHEFYTLQVRHRFPGLVNECRSLLKHYQLPDIIDGNYVFTKNSWKVLVKKSVKKK